MIAGGRETLKRWWLSATRIGVVDLTVAMGLILVLGFIQNLVLARLLGPAGLGHVSIITAALNIGILIGSGGLTTAILRHGAAQQQDNAGFGVYRMGVTLALFSSIVAASGPEKGEYASFEAWLSYVYLPVVQKTQLKLPTRRTRHSLSP